MLSSIVSAVPAPETLPDAAIVRSSFSALIVFTLSEPDPSKLASALPSSDAASIEPEPATVSERGAGIVTFTVTSPPSVHDPFSRIMPNVPSSLVKRSRSATSSSPSTAILSDLPFLITTLSGPASNTDVGASPDISRSASGTPSLPPILMSALQPVVAPAMAVATAIVAMGAAALRIL